MEKAYYKRKSFAFEKTKGTVCIFIGFLLKGPVESHKIEYYMYFCCLINLTF